MIGLSTAQIGFGLSLAGVAGLLALVPVGVQAWRAGWFAVYPFVPGMALFVLVAAAVGTAAAFRRYAPADRRSAYLSVYTLGATGTGIAGPLLVTVAVVDRGVPGWLGLAALLAAAGAAVPVLVRRDGTDHRPPDGARA